MNRSKIEWCDHTWNPITGCRNGCEYCYARKMTARFSGDVRLNLMAKSDYRTQDAPDGSGKVFVLDSPMLNGTGHALTYPFGFEPTLHRYRMNMLDKLKMGNNIFVGAMADVFGAWVPEEWIEEVLNVCVENSMHNYMFLTKNPERYWELDAKAMLPSGENMWYGFSYTCNDDQSWSSLNGDKNTFISVEPLLEDLRLFDTDMLCPTAKWVIIGAETGNRKNKVIPRYEWIEKILRHCKKFGIPVFMKNSMISIVGEGNMRREFPPQLLNKKQSEKVKARLEGNCCHCGIHMRKNRMIALCARAKRGKQPEQFAYMCKDCFVEFCNENGIDVPELEGLYDKETKLSQNN